MKESNESQVQKGEASGVQQVYEQVGVAMTCRSYREYELMFALNEELMRRGRILDVAAGASSFAAEARGKGMDVYSADPRYALDGMQLEQEGREEIELSTGKLAKLAHKFDWSYYGNLEQHKAGRLQALERFAADYKTPAGKSRYASDPLPALAYPDNHFALVLCSHFLFLYGEQFSQAFHEQALSELLRVCAPGGEIRIYPIVTLHWERYSGLDRLISLMEASGAECRLIVSRLPFIPGSTEMLAIRKLPS